MTAADRTAHASEELLRQVAGNTTHLKTWSSRITGALGFMGKLISATTALAPVMETMGAKFSKSFEASRDEAMLMSEKFQKAGIPANVYENFAFGLQASRLGLNKNSEAMMDLFKVTLATGENFGKLQAGLFGATVGMKRTDKSMSTLYRAVDKNSIAFNLSREELVAALQALSRDTLNLMAATGNNNTLLQETTVGLQALIPDQRLFSQAVGNLQKQFTMGGLVESLAMGFPVDEMMKNQMTDTQVLKAILDQGTQADKLLSGQGRTLIFQADAMKGAFGDLLSKQATATQMRNRMLKVLEDEGIQTKGMTDVELITGMKKITDKASKNQKQFLNTMAMLKREIITPLINQMSQFFMSIKDTLRDPEFKAMLSKILVGVGKGIIIIAEGILQLVKWVAGLIGAGSWQMDIADAAVNLKKVRMRITQMAKNSDEQLKIKKDEDERKADSLATALKTSSTFQIKQLVLVNRNLTNLIKGNTAIAKNTGKTPNQPASVFVDRVPSPGAGLAIDPTKGGGN